jgi:hypothetical protein
MAVDGLQYLRTQSPRVVRAVLSGGLADGDGLLLAQQIVDVLEYKVLKCLS